MPGPSVSSLARITAPGPGQNGAAPITTSGASQNQAIPPNAKRIVMTTTADVHVRFGSGAQTATVNDMLVPGKVTVVFDLLPAQNNFAVIQDAAPGVLSWVHQ